MQRKRVAILISGRGSNMEALLRASAAPDFPAEIGLVLSDKEDAGGLVTASGAGIATAIVSAREFPKRADREKKMQQILEAAGTELVCLAGYMRILSPEFVQQWKGRMINIHPSLLPSFPGLDTHARALESGCRIHGATVHHVTAELDMGPIIAQAAVPVLPMDDEASLAARVLRAEHRLYPLALRRVAGGPNECIDTASVTSTEKTLEDQMLICLR